MIRWNLSICMVSYSSETGLISFHHQDRVDLLNVCSSTKTFENVLVTVSNIDSAQLENS